MERTVNSIPIGYLHHSAGGINPLLRILTPNSLRLISTSDRAPAGLFNLPDDPAGIMDSIQEKYQLWYQVWNTDYIPLVMDRQKWHFRKENLLPGDIVYFKLRESKMSAWWKIGKVEQVDIGTDGYARQVTIAYKDTTGDDASNWRHRTVDRPTRNICKLFHINDTCLMDDIQEVYRVSKDLMEKEKMSSFNTNFAFYATLASLPMDITDVIEEDVIANDYSTEFSDDLIQSAAPFIHNFWKSASQNDVDQGSYQQFEGVGDESDRDRLFNDFETYGEFDNDSFNVLMI